MNNLQQAIENTRTIARQDPKTSLEATAKLTEEVGELMREVLIRNKVPGTTYRETSDSKLCEELADVLLCVFSIAEKLELSDDALAEQMTLKAVKWEKNLLKDNVP